MSAAGSLSVRQVSEPKVENSGMSQGPSDCKRHLCVCTLRFEHPGTWIKRHRLPKPECMGGGLYTCDDLRLERVFVCSMCRDVASRVGCTISIYSQLFRLVACDQPGPLLTAMSVLFASFGSWP